MAPVAFSPHISIIYYLSLLSASRIQFSSLDHALICLAAIFVLPFAFSQLTTRLLSASSLSFVATGLCVPFRPWSEIYCFGVIISKACLINLTRVWNFSLLLIVRWRVSCTSCAVPWTAGHTGGNAQNRDRVFPGAAGFSDVCIFILLITRHSLRTRDLILFTPNQLDLFLIRIWVICNYVLRFLCSSTTFLVNPVVIDIDDSLVSYLAFNQSIYFIAADMITFQNVLFRLMFDAEHWGVTCGLGDRWLKETFYWNLIDFLSCACFYSFRTLGHIFFLNSLGWQEMLHFGYDLSPGQAGVEIRVLCTNWSNLCAR